MVIKQDSVFSKSSGTNLYLCISIQKTIRECKLAFALVFLYLLVSLAIDCPLTVSADISMCGQLRKDVSGYQQFFIPCSGNPSLIILTYSVPTTPPGLIDGAYYRVTNAQLTTVRQTCDPRLGCTTTSLFITVNNNPYSNWQKINSCASCVQVIVPTIRPITPLPPPTSPPSPVISFRADRTTIQRGECLTLYWDVDNVNAIYLDGQGVVGHDTRQVCPSANTSYTLRVVTDGGDVFRTVNIAVSQPPTVPPPPPTSIPLPPPPVLDFRVDQSMINRGQCTTLRWDAAFVDALYLNGNLVSNHGTSQVCPTSTATYDFRYVARSMDSTQSVTVNVIQPTATSIPIVIQVPTLTNTLTRTPTLTPTATNTTLPVPADTPQLIKPLIVTVGFRYPGEICLGLGCAGYKPGLDTRAGAKPTSIQNVAASGYRVLELENQKVDDVVNQLKESSIFYFFGHGAVREDGLSMVMFWDGAQKSLLLGGQNGPDNPGGPPIRYAGQIQTANLRLVVINACETGTDITSKWNLLKSFSNLGVDMVIGFNSDIHPDSAKRWGDTFWADLANGKGAREAAEYAAKEEDKYWWPPLGRINKNMLVILSKDGADIVVAPAPPHPKDSP